MYKGYWCSSYTEIGQLSLARSNKCLPTLKFRDAMPAVGRMWSVKTWLYGWLATFLQATWMNGRTMCWLTSHWLIRSPQITRRPSLVLGYSTLGQVQIGHWILSFTRKLLQQTPRFPLALPCVIHFARSDNPSFCSLSILFLFCQLEKQRNNLQRK